MTDTAPVPTSKTSRFVWTDRRIGVALATIAILIIGVGAGVSGLVSRSNRNSPLIARTALIAEDTSESLAIIKDTIDPGGERFQRGQDAQAVALQSLNEITVLANFCGHRTNDLDGLKECVLREYQKSHPGTLTTTTTTTADP